MANQYTKELVIGDLQHMMKYVMPEPNTGCWIWNHTINQQGYGVIIINHKLEKAHRLYYTLFKGKIPKRLLVCHPCDNTFCVNPDHLWLGTSDDNNKDRMNKGRGAFGERSGASKLTESGILEIRNLYSKGVPRKIFKINLEYAILTFIVFIKKILETYMTITPINLRTNARIRSNHAVMSCMDTLIYFNKDAINRLGCPSRVIFDDLGTSDWFIKKDESGFNLRRKNEYGGMITQNSRVLISRLESIFGKKKPKFILLPSGNLDIYQLKLIE